MLTTKDGIMVVLSSPSGAGKTTLVKLLSKNKNYNISISHTTRKPRNNEIPGKDYYFVNNKEFNDLISKNEFLEYAKKHTNEMEKIILRYNNLQIPQSFVSSVELFKLSAETQLESDHYMIEWVRTGEDTAHIRSDSLLQQSFDYEMAALAKFKSAQGQTNP